MEFYTWQNYRCAFETVPPRAQGSQQPALLLIHPIGVGLSRKFWQPFIQQLVASSVSDHKTAVNSPTDRTAAASIQSRIYSVDLLGCGDSDMPQRAYDPKDWAEQLAYFIETEVRSPVVLVVQGALLPVAVRLMALTRSQNTDYIKGMVLSGPPAWRLMSTPTEPWKQTLAWRLFTSPLGNLFYRYARREKFLDSFSKRQLFESPEDVSEQWLSMLDEGAQDIDSRYAVFSFLAGFWRQDYTQVIARIQQPVLIVMGQEASTIDRSTAQKEEAREEESQQEASRQRLQDYLDHFPRAQGVTISGRNVLPYESTAEFVEAIAPFITSLSP